MAKMWKWAAIILAVVLVWMNWDKIKGMISKDESPESAAAAAVAAAAAESNASI